MAVVKMALARIPYIGLSTDSKPTTSVPPGSTFYETDTSSTYIYSGTAWVVYIDPSGGSVGSAVISVAIDAGGGIAIGSTAQLVFLEISNSADLIDFDDMLIGQVAVVRAASGITVPIKDTGNINGGAVGGTIGTLNHVDDVFIGHYDGTNVIKWLIISNG